MNNILLLGYGFTSKYLKIYLEQRGYNVFSTSRTNKDLIYFDLEDENSYENIKDNYNIIWTFPAKPLDKVKKVYDSLNTSKIIIVFGTTSSYIQEDIEITEESKLDISKERVQGELFLHNKGTNLVNLSGIYGNERNPYNWLNRGLIKNSNKLVNLIHIDDICKFTNLLLENNINNEIFNLSDGKPYLWKDIWEKGIEKKFTNVDCPEYSNFEGKKVINNKVLKYFPEFKFQELI